MAVGPSQPVGRGFSSLPLVKHLLMEAARERKQNGTWPIQADGERLTARPLPQMRFPNGKITNEGKFTSFVVKNIT